MLLFLSLSDRRATFGMIVVKEIWAKLFEEVTYIITAHKVIDSRLFSDRINLVHIVARLAVFAIYDL